MLVHLVEEPSATLEIKLREGSLLRKIFRLFVSVL